MGKTWEFIVPKVSDDNPGVSYRTVGGGADALVVFGGWGVRNDGARAWADALVAAKVPKLAAVGHAFAVRGPHKSGRKDKEEAPCADKIGSRFTDLGKIESIFVISHSSGGKFLDLFLHELPKDADVVGWDLDGFAPEDKRFKFTFIKRADPSIAAHMQLVNKASVAKHLTEKDVNAEYVSVNAKPGTVCTSYLK